MANQLTPEHIKSFLARYEHPADARKFLQEAGLVDEHGILTEPYRPDPKPMTDFNYQRAYNHIALLVGGRFPECEVTVVDMVRLLCLENDTLRMTIGMPLAKAVVDIVDPE
jgi:hypothetical protein